MNQETILTCAITGSGTTKEQTPFLPVTPEEIAISSLEAAEAGASVIHIHVRDPKTSKPSMDFDLYNEVVEKIRKDNKEVLLNLTTGPGSTGPSDVIFGKHYPNFKSAIERVSHILKLKPEICSLDLNTMNRNLTNITVNTIDVAKEISFMVKQAGVKPELEIFDSGDLHIAKMLIKEGYIEDPPLWQIATGIKWGWDASIQTLEYARKLLPINANWYAFGIGAMQMPFVALSTISGGNARVGLEDNIYLEKGKLAKTNKQLVEKAVRIIKDLGGNIATPDQARKTFKIKSNVVV
ncbi:MAG: 3-keto-5-aminohexanoate cleavage protein [Synechococcaceae bacterium WB6_1A_059]|nr:3-keto-5-aminohexanoate cleavage protein [Synechococcaceae bacterium WB6_1A_059]